MLYQKIGIYGMDNQETLDKFEKKHIITCDTQKVGTNTFLIKIQAKNRSEFFFVKKSKWSGLFDKN